MKKSRLILMFALLTALLVGAVAAAVAVFSAADPTLVYDGKTGQFTLENVQNDDLFPNFKDLMPGDERTQDIKLVVKNLQTPTTLYLTSTPDEATKKALEPLTLTVTRDGADLGEFARSAAENVPLGVFRKDGSTTLHVKLSVPTSVGNELQEAQASLCWDFIARQTTGGGGHGGGGGGGSHGGGGGGGIPGGSGGSPAQTPSSFLDRANHYDYIVGFPDGTVRPEALITRAETATIFFRLLTDGARQTYLTKADYHVFDDVAQDAWYATTVNTLNRMGIILGRSPTLFVPEANITRAEFATLAARFSDGKGSSSATFSDIQGHWAEDYIQKAAAEGWIVGYEDGTFRPDNPITRAEAMTLINRVLLRVPEQISDLTADAHQWPDNAPSAWYYLAVQEATHSHNYTRKGTAGEQWTALLPGKDWLIYQ